MSWMTQEPLLVLSIMLWRRRTLSSHLYFGHNILLQKVLFSWPKRQNYLIKKEYFILITQEKNTKATQLNTLTYLDPRNPSNASNSISSSPQERSYQFFHLPHHSNRGKVIDIWKIGIEVSTSFALTNLPLRDMNLEFHAPSLVCMCWITSCQNVFLLGLSLNVAPRYMNGTLPIPTSKISAAKEISEIPTLQPITWDFA